MPAITFASIAAPRRIVVPWPLAIGYVGGMLDLLVAMAYWAPRGVAAQRIPQGIASWLLGSAAFHGGFATAAFGLLVYGLLLSGVAAAYAVVARRHSLLLGHPYLFGALYGFAAYAAIFHLLAPLLSGTRPVHELLWTVTCLLAYAALVGIPSALYARAQAIAQGA